MPTRGFFGIPAACMGTVTTAFATHLLTKVQGAPRPLSATLVTAAAVMSFLLVLLEPVR